MRHDKVGSRLHYSVYKALGIATTDRRHTHTHMRARAHKPIYEHKDVTVLPTQGAHRQNFWQIGQTHICV